MFLEQKITESGSATQRQSPRQMEATSVSVLSVAFPFRVVYGSPSRLLAFHRCHNSPFLDRTRSMLAFNSSSRSDTISNGTELREFCLSIAERASYSLPDTSRFVLSFPIIDISL
eukprot:gb/GECG01001092.1/.p1 GENE.gb/GECG01001092.1/~~gb/GECG01001092.1/.p1  ORF type:complete len:115 (+),score=6.04 gb/GECG01001092.1/:1-345(+)